MPQVGPQATAIRRDLIDELLFGGAVFGGKSDFLLGDFAQDVPGPYGQYWHGILFRKTYAELEELIARSHQIYPRWFGLDVSKSWSQSEKTWTWPNGATLKMRYLESEHDWQRYWGHAYTWIGWDELALWPSMMPYKRMKARLRSAQASIPNKRIRASANPGGAGHLEVRSYFGIDRWPLGGHEFEVDGMKRVFIRSRLQDNKIGTQNDPNYERRLDGVGSPEFVRALKDGDWNIIEGAYFPEFGIEHIVDPIELPDHLIRIRAMDWGSAKPFSVGWYTVSDGDSVPYPRGALIKYREWYGTSAKKEGDSTNVGLKLTAEEVAQGILDRQLTDERIDDSVLDPSAFARDGGPSIAERMGDKGVDFRRADNKRVGPRGAMGGWDSLRARLKGDLDGRPMLYFFSTCVHTIRTLPALQHDELRPEDVDTDSEDHAGDETRYACMARPWVRDAPESHPVKFGLDRTFNEIVSARRRRRLGDG